jgi:hypothetical protein
VALLKGDPATIPPGSPCGKQAHRTGLVLRLRFAQQPYLASLSENLVGVSTPTNHQTQSVHLTCYPDRIVSHKIDYWRMERQQISSTLLEMTHNQS